MVKTKAPAMRATALDIAAEMLMIIAARQSATISLLRFDELTTVEVSCHLIIALVLVLASSC